MRLACNVALVLTNQHVLGPTDYIAVQFDSITKIAAVKLLADPEKDVAVIWADMSAFPNAIAAPLATTSSGEPAAIEGERVFTIGSPLTQQKIVTTGIVSKIEPHAIISDIRIDHGNSGGPLFNSLGQVPAATSPHKLRMRCLPHTDLHQDIYWTAGCWQLRHRTLGEITCTLTGTCGGKWWITSRPFAVQVP